MIDYVRGPVSQVAEDYAVIDLGGLGIRVEANPATLAGLKIGEVRELPTALIVREDSWTLYGFCDAGEREVFELAQTVSGIGPRTAQTLVSTLSADGLRRAVGSEDIAALTAVPGIGRKGAQRIILELADRLGPGSSSTVPVGARPLASNQMQARDGLVALGWSAREAEDAVRTVIANADDSGGDLATGFLLKAALRELNRS
ncbi:MAG: Holliday junction branch migration protein RuvA [Candidatus Nanopelagicales bacterium]|nr:Holliday junction branch migration protein RuvA [Candidatus Nanopelagicales bacterium]MDZ4249163.1 Holliday junction branch migration protein RuvA [Candidatus Nanopelagicales bacterium]MDZ7576665.1 Holliday junction branch migration protein RuvA [Candidatus Nanopelagicales bacterium]